MGRRKGAKSLNARQLEFMKVLHRTVADANSPASVSQIRIHFKKSDSRVRSHIKVLMRAGWIHCVGKAKEKRYVPSMLWLEEIDVHEEYDEDDLPCVGGYCQTPGCNQMAQDFWRNGYYCRTCIVGHDLASDMRDIREQHEARISPVSSAGQLLDYVTPTFAEDLIEDVEQIRLPKSRRKRTQKKQPIKGKKNAI